ncbi:hypothetical protein [Sphingobacterium deserti]|uniref:Uncharacterized protein n=1 Tax=Sphingobacterium deserti TaxID=1229276 RepID=A0A0B8T6C9_9SPHI|nr:hypothetical protein [Sphingobacterium deserti]KGE13559.1 hypothetical protein DI53_2620 [Sphingobacterium deserti]
MRHIFCRLSGYLLVLCCFSTISTYAQQRVGFDIDFFGYADNREYKSIYTEPKTIFGTLMSPNVYFAIDSNNRIIGGLHYNQDFGRHPENKNRVSPIAYYQYKNKNFDFALGHMPRYERLKDVPRIVLADTFLYDRPNLEGMYLSFQKRGLKQALYIDWLSKQSFRYREQFVVGLTGKYAIGDFYIKDDALLYHNALTSNDSIDEHIQDNGLVMLRAGVDFSRKTFLDSLTVEVGGVVGFDRVRTVYDLRSAKGLIATAFLGYKRFFVENTIYVGDAQNLPNGDSFYHRKRYNRLDLGWVPFRKGNLDGKFTASFHFAPDGSSNQQAFTLRYRFGADIWEKK